MLPQPNRVYHTRACVVVQVRDKSADNILYALTALLLILDFLLTLS